MTAHSKDEGLRAARRIVDGFDTTLPLAVDALTVARALLSSSAAERAVREALEEIAAGMGWDHQRNSHRRKTIAREALATLSSARAGEEEQARPSASAPISTDTKGTTK